MLRYGAAHEKRGSTTSTDFGIIIILYFILIIVFSLYLLVTKKKINSSVKNITDQGISPVRDGTKYSLEGHPKWVWMDNSPHTETQIRFSLAFLSLLYLCPKRMSHSPTSFCKPLCLRVCLDVEKEGTGQEKQKTKASQGQSTNFIAPEKQRL